MVALLRPPAVCKKMGKGRATLHEDVKRGVLPPPVKLGSRWSAWPEHEIDQILRARIADWTDNQLRALVRCLVADRKRIAPEGIAEERRAADAMTAAQGWTPEEPRPIEVGRQALVIVGEEDALNETTAPGGNRAHTR